MQLRLVTVTNPNGFGQRSKEATLGLAEAPHGTEADLFERDTLERAQGGDRDALEALLEAARPRLCAVAFKMLRDRDDAEDVVQDAMLKVWRAMGKFEGRAALSTWLHRILVNTAVDRLRSRRQGLKMVRPGGAGADCGEDDRPQPEAVHEETPESQLGSAEIGAAVRGAMSRLSPAHQEVLALRELDGESYQSIAAIARCPVGTVMSRLHHARGRLGEVLLSGPADLLPQAA